MLCFTCKTWYFPPFFIIFQNVVIVEFLLIFLPKNSSLFLFYNLYNISKRQICRERVGQREKLWRVAKLVSFVCSLSWRSRPTLSIISFFPCMGQDLSSDPFNQTFDTITFLHLQEHWRIKSSVSSTIISKFIKRPFQGGGGESRFGRSRSSAPPLCPRGSPVSVARISTHLPHARPSPSRFSFCKMVSEWSSVFISTRALQGPINS